MVHEGHWAHQDDIENSAYESRHCKSQPIQLKHVRTISFDILFGGEVAKYIGAIIGLSIGYTIKYQLDYKYVFKS